MTKKALNIFFYPVVVGFLLSVITMNHCDNAAAAARIDEIIDTSATVTAQHERAAGEATREAERQAAMAKDYRKQSGIHKTAADAARTAGEKLRAENDGLKEIVSALHAKSPCTGVDIQESSRIELINMSSKLCLLQAKSAELITGLNNEIDNHKTEAKELRLSLTACRKESGALQAAAGEQKKIIFQKNQIIENFENVTIPGLEKEAKRKRGFMFKVRYVLIGAGAALIIYLK